MGTNGRASHTHRGPKSRWLVQWVGALLWTAFFGRNGNDYLQLPSGSLQKAVHLRFFNSSSRSLSLSYSILLSLFLLHLLFLPTENKTWNFLLFCWCRHPLLQSCNSFHLRSSVCSSVNISCCSLVVYPDPNSTARPLVAKLDFFLPMDRRLQSQKRPSVDSSIAHFAKASGNYSIPLQYFSFHLISQVYTMMDFEFELIDLVLIRFLWSSQSSADSSAHTELVGFKQQAQLQFRIESNESVRHGSRCCCIS